MKVPAFACSAIVITFSAAAILSPGSLDPAFSLDGKTTTAFGSGNDIGYAVAIQADGKILVAGSAWNGSNLDFALVRYLSDGSLDTTFDGDGRVVTEIGAGDDAALTIAIQQQDGKIIIAGYTFSIGDTTRDFALARYHPNGSLDLSFDLDGKVIIDFGCSCDAARSIALQPDGKLVAVGPAGGSTVDFGVARFNADGSLDSSFDLDGKVTTDIGNGSIDASNAVTLQPDGKIVAAGSSYQNPTIKDAFALARYNADGSLDPTFDGDGRLTTTMWPGIGIRLAGDVVHAIALQENGKILAAGDSTVDIGLDEVFALARYNTDGSLDTSYGAHGKLLIGYGINAESRDIVVQPDRKILVGGFGGIDDSDMLLIRLMNNGVSDTAFGTNGVVVTPFGNGFDHIHGMALQSDGNIVAAGQAFIGGNLDFAVTRYIGGDAVDSAPFDFDGDGKTDIAIFRPNGPASEWWINRSSTGVTFALQFGASTDLITPADYTGDGKADIAFFRPASGEWYVLRSEDFSFFALPFGTNGDVPVPADYDADGKADFAVFRPSSSTWFISQSSGAPTRILQFGITGDQPVVADYDGDGKADIGIFRNNAGVAEWWVDRSTAGLLAMQFGNGTDEPVQGDFTGDGKADIAIWRPSDGNWLIVRSEDFSFFSFPFGTTGDVVAPGDYDGDGKFDATVFRPSNATWFIGRTTAGTQIVQFGATGDRPVANAFVP